MTLTKKKEFSSWISAILLYLLLMPYFVWTITDYQLYYAITPLSFIFYINRKQGNTDFGFAMGFIFLVLVASFTGGKNIFGFLSCAFLASVFLVNKDYMSSTYTKFRNIYAVLISLSLISYFLVMFLNVHLPYTTIDALNILKSHNYYAYPFLITSDTHNIVEKMFRFHGLFDEPGVVGTMSLLFLFIEKFNLRKWYNVVILISGIMSFSMFFFAATLIYLFYYVFTNSKSSVFFKLLVVGLVVFGSIKSMDNDVAQMLIWDRFTWDASENKFAGDSRAASDLETYVDGIRGTSQYFFGGTDMATRDSFRGSYSIQNIILDYGLIIVILYFLFYSAFSHRYIRESKRYLLFLAILFLTFYNRPAIFVMTYHFLFASMVYSFSKD